MKNLLLSVNGKSFNVHNPRRDGSRICFLIEGTPYTVEIQSTAVIGTSATELTTQSRAESDTVIAPMPGVVISLPAKEGQRVTKGTTVVVIEAMKMENSITAPRDGVVSRVQTSLGEEVRAGQELLYIK